MIDLVLTWAVASLKEDWRCAHLCLCPMKPWYPKLAILERITSWPADLSLFLGRSDGYPHVIRDEEKMAWAVFRLQCHA